MKTTLILITSIFTITSSRAAIQLNEIFLNPTSTDNTQEFIELRSTTDGMESLAGLTFINLEGNAAGSGNIDSILGARTLRTRLRDAVVSRPPKRRRFRLGM